MSDLSAMAASFEKQSKERAESIENSVKSALAAHEKVLIQCLKNEQQRIEGAIRGHSRKMRLIMLKTWLSCLILIAATLVIASGVIWWQAQTLMQQHNEINERQQILADLPNLNVLTCGPADLPCVQVITSTTYTNDSGTKNYMLLPQQD